jgi:DNA-binding transcriptional ArsR family regulator
VSLPAVTVSQSPEDKFREYLASRARPQRYTGQQRDLVRFIFSQHNHFDADQLIDAMKQAGMRVSRATVYRTLSKLVDAGLLRRLELGPRMYYEHDYGVSKPRARSSNARSVPTTPFQCNRPYIRHPRHLRGMQSGARDEATLVGSDLTKLESRN